MEAPSPLIVSITSYQPDYLDLEDPDDEGLWELQFEFRIVDIDLKYTFIVTEPYNLSMQNWEDFMSFDPSTPSAPTRPIRILNMYQGDGEGSISSNGTLFAFNSSPSGGGGDVITEFAIHKKHVIPSLRRALDDAVLKQYTFDQ